MNFASTLRMQLEAAPHLNHRGERILAIINTRSSKKRTRQIERMQRHVEVEFGEWEDIDWPAMIARVLKFLLALLPFIL